MRGDQPTALDRLAACLEEAVTSLWRRRQVAGATTLLIGITLTFPTLVLTLLGWVGAVVAGLGQSDRVRVFLAPGATAAEIAALRVEAEAAPGVTSVAHVTEDDAREAFLRSFPELAEVALDLTPEELRLPASLEIACGGGPEAGEALVRRLAGRPGVEAVRHDAIAGERVVALERSIAAARAAVAAMALGLVLAAIGNVARIAALSRREELAIMRLVGAPRFHVRVPFALEGLVQGACGGLVAYGALWLCVAWLGPLLSAFVPPASEGLPRGTFPALVAAPAAAGVAAAAVAVEAVLRRHARLET